MGKTKATLDTNILISAFWWNGNPHKVFDEIISGRVEMVISDELFYELSEVLGYQKFEFIDEEKKSGFKALVLEVATFVKPLEKINEIKKDIDDNVVLECAVAGNADYIVSGDPHLLELKEFRGIKIITAKEFLEKLNR